MGAVLVRQWMVLLLLPKPPRKIDTSFIESELRSRGVEVHRRTIQRDLVELSRVFSLVADARSKPYGWRWSEDAVFVGGLPVPKERTGAKNEIGVRLRGPRAVLQIVLGELHAREARFTDGGVSGTIEDSDATRRLLLAHADDVEVLEPASLRRDLAARARRAAVRHEK